MENKITMHDYAKMIIISAMLVLIGQWVGNGVNPIEALPGMIIISIVVVLGLFLKHVIPLNFPAFAWVTLLGLVCSLPATPGSDIFMAYTSKVGFLATTTPILAFAGISVGNKIDLLKKLSWKLVIIAMVVFSSTFFGSALVSQLVLSMQGKI